MKKLILLFAAIAFPVVASPVSTTTSTQTIAGKSVTIIQSPTTACYRMTWAVVTGGENPGVRLKYFKYTTGVTLDEDNMYCATTYAEMATEATTLGIAKIPAQVNGQP